MYLNKRINQEKINKKIIISKIKGNHVNEEFLKSDSDSFEIEIEYNDSISRNNEYVNKENTNKEYFNENTNLKIYLMNWK